MSLLSRHLDNLEREIFAKSETAKSAKHGTQIGTARENFVKQFLEDNHGEAVTITGPGEIIDCNSTDQSPAKQFDIIVHYRNYPKLQISKSVNIILVESVVAAIEVKSSLNKKELRKAIHSAKHLKSLQRQPYSGLSLGSPPDQPLALLVSYDLKCSISHVREWILDIYEELELSEHQYVPGQEVPGRSVALDAICILGKGIAHYNGLSCGLEIAFRDQNTNWTFAEREVGSLGFLFALLNSESKRWAYGFSQLDAYFAGSWEGSAQFDTI